MDKQLLNRVIERKRKLLSTFTLEQIGITGFIGGFVGLVVGEFYGAISGKLIWHVANVFLYASIGMILGYFNSKSKKEDLQVELMILENFQKSQ
ncbi:MAG: hypothetical protein ACRC3Y_06950 [Romboutsia sp.]|uniref:hypothetical protein n=1 Tax=Romboutsia sp. TaxID=1965302 RepID=UPI003F2B0D5E